MKQKRTRKKGPGTSRKPGVIKGVIEKDVDLGVSEELARFIECHPARRLSKNLRKMLIEFLTYEGATEAGYLQDLLYDLQGLFEFLEVIQQRQESTRK